MQFLVHAAPLLCPKLRIGYDGVAEHFGLNHTVTISFQQENPKLRAFRQQVPRKVRQLKWGINDIA
jgi:hypothetical protein